MQIILSLQRVNVTNLPPPPPP